MIKKIIITASPNKHRSFPTSINIEWIIPCRQDGPGASSYLLYCDLVSHGAALPLYFDGELGG